MKFALVSHTLPPAPNGQAIVLQKLLQAIEPADYCLVSAETDRASLSATHAARFFALPARYLPLRGARSTPARFVRQVLKALCAPVTINRQARHLARIIREERCEAVITCTGDPVDFPAAWLACRQTGARLYLYYFDDFIFQWIGPLARQLATLMEHTLLRDAHGVIAPNEFMQAALRRRGGIEATIIRNPVDLDVYPAIPEAPLFTRRPIRVVYTGSINDAHLDAFRRLAQALELLGDTPVELHLYTSTPRAALEQAGITGRVVVHDFLPPSEIPATQQAADILFLPMAFHSPYPEVIATSSPGKMGEYLAAGRPILVHAPDDSFLAWYFRRHQCGRVVPEPAPEALAAAIAALLADPSAAQSLCRNAQARAREDFAVPSAQGALRALLALDSDN